MSAFETVIGLEVHLQLATRTKIFCGCPTLFGSSPNSQTCPVCLGLPGVLPVLNRRTLESGLKVALALNCRIQPALKFHRKNYFYPDLPKGFQISQYDLPLSFEGVLEVPAAAEAPAFAVRIHRAHLEEDAGKLVHKEGSRASLVDYNRAGIPLLEIVTEPDMRTPEEAYRCLQTLKHTLQYLDVSDCDMEKGSLRCDANISLRPAGAKELGVKTEIKNLNSFKHVRNALAYEIRRQQEALSSGGKVIQETRLWDDVKGVTLLMRSKEFAHDYRYFPEPDLVPFVLQSEEIQAVRRTLPELPPARTRRFMEQYGLSSYDAGRLTSEKQLADYFESAVQAGGVPKATANWIQGDLLAACRERNVEILDLKVPAAHLAQLVLLVEHQTVSSRMAKDLLKAMMKTGEAPEPLVKRLGMSQVTDSGTLQAAAQTVVQGNPKAVSDYRAGKRQAIKFLVGQLMARTKGQANPELAHRILESVLKEGA
ncbi:MAG: Asp-tRNA(Asn)/Glu-tRNA(Gln) amidotransferase subunit GatB [Candidatus Omnitrophica bacterium]|nr:Asp-tRNA(Asn)/Glu-tRNA(Gln) amidotransferase subunit GatB [Candidatus Omnitrophota bacterium]